jgi:hypothetical protein
MIREGETMRLNRSGMVMGSSVVCKPSVQGCLHCAFSGDCHGMKIGRPKCMSFERPDRVSVIFKPY